MRRMKALLVTLALLAALSAPALAQEREGWHGEHEGEHGWWGGGDDGGGWWGGGDDGGGWWGGGDDDDNGGYIPYIQAYGPYVNPYSIAQNYGYQDGFNAGAYDREHQREYGYRGSYYQRGDHGYLRKYGDKGRYRNWYRQSYMHGYQKGFRGRGR